LAEAGHDVVHQYCSSYVTGRGAVESRPDDPPSFAVEPVSLGGTFERYTVTRRVLQELQYGRIAHRAILRHRPDAAVLSNVPLLSLVVLTALLRRSETPFVFWQQDVYSAAIRSAASRRLGALGMLVGWLADRIERRVARASGAVIPISPSFLPQLHAWGIPSERIRVIENWAPIDELPMHARDNDWARDHALHDTPVVLYSGTLGLKHDPMLLADAAEALRDEATVVVISQGLGREVLEEQRRARKLDNLTLLDFQPYEVLPKVLASADVLVVVLEPDASRYSVPSKALTYLCAGRPIVAVIPADNSVAVILRGSHSGVVVPPGDHATLITSLRELLTNEKNRMEMGRNARQYAEDTFDVTVAAKEFAEMLTLVVSGSATTSRASA
jgi:glycosyltransferase involved in cell wall biosynthesis